MAQTDSRAGFRLPWTSERSTSESSETQQADAEHDSATDWPLADQAASPSVDGGYATEAAADEDSSAVSAPHVDAPTEAAGPATATRKPSKFLADLTKAMQTAAEEARALSLTQFQGEAKAYVEQIGERSSTEAAALRRAADDDVAAVREWSKAEIARIREETETRISARKGRLETEIEEHKALIDREIERVHGRVAAFEQEMADFFERLLAENDPTRFATMAERLPEPPPFEEMSADSSYVFASAAAVAAPVVPETADEVTAEVETPDEVAAEAANDVEVETVDADAELGTAETDAELGTAETDTTETPEAEAVTFDGEVPEGFEVDREAAFAAIQAAAEAAASAEVASDAAARAEAVADIAIEIVGSHEDDGDNDGRGYGQTDFDAAEAEAAASADASQDDEIPVIGDDALAARLADLLPGNVPDSAATDNQTTQVVVVGLVSVASIASFKRHLGRLPGVRSVGVSSGPDGEFLFAVHHSADVVLRDAIPSMPSFQARVTGAADGTVNVTAHDPESDN